MGFYCRLAPILPKNGILDDLAVTIKKKRKASRAMPVRRKRRRSRKVKPAGQNDHALKFIQHYDPFKAEPYIPPRTEDYGVIPDNPQPVTADELAFQRQYRKRRQ